MPIPNETQFLNSQVFRLLSGIVIGISVHILTLAIQFIKMCPRRSSMNYTSKTQSSSVHILHNLSVCAPSPPASIHPGMHTYSHPPNHISASIPCTSISHSCTSSSLCHTSIFSVILIIGWAEFVKIGSDFIYPCSPLPVIHPSSWSIEPLFRHECLQ